MQLSSTTSSAVSNLPAKVKYPKMTADEIEQYAQDLAAEYALLVGEVFKDGMVDIDLIAEHFIYESGYRFGFVEKPFFVAGNYTEYGRTVFSRKIVEITQNDRICDKTVRTTLAHEMFHVLKHSEYALASGMQEMTKDLEGDAKLFARVFMLPKEAFTQRFNELFQRYCLVYDPFGRFHADEGSVEVMRVGVVPRLSDAFGVSTGAINLRIKQLNLLGCRKIAEDVLLEKNRTYRF